MCKIFVNIAIDKFQKISKPNFPRGDIDLFIAGYLQSLKNQLSQLI